MNTIIHPTLVGSNNLNDAVDRLLATALTDLQYAIQDGCGGYSIHPGDHLARLARRQHGADLVTARRVLAVLQGRIGAQHKLTTPRRLALRLRIAQRATATAPTTSEALRRVKAVA